MASLRIAFIQTYQSGNPCFNLLSSISCLLSTLFNLEDNSAQQAETSPSRKVCKRTNRFVKVQQILKESKDRQTWIDSFSKPSLVQIRNHDLPDFENGKKRRDFFHALELIGQEFEETSQILTVKSEEINFGQIDPNSTQVSLESDMDLSQLDDF